MFGVRTLVLAGAVYAATMDLTACTSSQASQDPRTVPQLAEVAVVQPAEVGERAFTGVVSARVQSNLGFRVSGKVIERVVDSGEAVHQGQPLMRLDRTDYVHAITTQVGNVDAARAREVVSHLEQYLSAFQLGITMVSLGLGWVGEEAFTGLLQPVLVAALGPWGEAAARSVALTLAFAIITVLHIVLGELVPKSLAIRKPGRCAAR